MMSVNSTVIMDTAKCNEESTNDVPKHTDKVSEYPFYLSSEKIDDSQINIIKKEPNEQQDAIAEKNIDKEFQIESEVKKEFIDLQGEQQTIKSECAEDEFLIASNTDATASQEKSTDYTINLSSSSHSKTYSSSREKRSKDDRRHCSQCYRRKKIKRASIGIQCKRDRHVLSSLNSKLLSFSKSNENLRLNLQTKSYKMLNNPIIKSELLDGLKYKKFIHIETYPNGGATVVHMYQDEIDNLSREQIEELTQEYFKVNNSIL